MEQLKKQHNEFKVPKSYTLISKGSKIKTLNNERDILQALLATLRTVPPIPAHQACACRSYTGVTISMPAQAKQYSHPQ